MAVFAELSYFAGCADNNACSKRIAFYQDGSANIWWLRSAYRGSQVSIIIFVDTKGNASAYSASKLGGIRPALILPSNITVDSNNFIVNAS